MGATPTNSRHQLLGNSRFKTNSRHQLLKDSGFKINSRHPVLSNGKKQEPLIFRGQQFLEISRSSVVLIDGYEFIRMFYAIPVHHFHRFFGHGCCDYSDLSASGYEVIGDVRTSSRTDLNHRAPNRARVLSFDRDLTVLESKLSLAPRPGNCF